MQTRTLRSAHASAHPSAFVLMATLAASLPASGCKHSAKIDDLRDALARDDDGAARAAIEGFPSCPELPPVAVVVGSPAPRDNGCLSAIANALGSKRGYLTTPPDQAAAAATAVVLVRDGRGDWIGHGSTWLAALRIGTGPGIDALRLAITGAMDRAAPSIGTQADLDDASARATMKAVAASIPGACPTYWLLGTGTDPKSLDAPLSADHSACIQSDLGTPSGPGPGYGSGAPRAVEGARASWREMALALRRGADRAAPPARALVEKRLTAIEARLATTAAAPARPRAANPFLSALHADAGILLDDAGAAPLDERGAAGPPPPSPSADGGTIRRPRAR